MATLYLTEFSALYAKNDQTGQMVICPPTAQQTVAIGAEAKSAAFNTATNIVRVNVDAICSITIGTAPTATTAMMRLAANQTEYFAVAAGDKLSAISNT
jgi:hypothetical protein